MPHRRLILSGLLASLAAPVLAQGKKSADKPGTGGDGMARAAAIGGRYSVLGKNPDGTEYRGTVWITQQGAAVEVTWEIGSDTYRGVGDITDRTVTVDWGDSTPVIYEVQSDGTLLGRWGAGTASEVLRPD